jgi:serine/threonine-protein kinase
MSPMADPVATLREGLRDRYAFERELGRGGMATVFLARDLKHDRPVALKVLHPELAASLGPERFLREIKLAARLQHPHILTVLDSGETAGRLWFTMPFVEGESLRDRLRRERQLAIEDALRITREAAQALQYAHGHGVIHRDIKPENLLLTDDGNTLVADFGIARSLGSGSDEKLTETGLVVGTPAYMSPEQAAGDRGLDARTDVYSLAAVLYEMLTGEPPFTGATTQAMLVRRLTEPAPSARSVRANLPEDADQAIRKALSPVAADRFATMAELGRALAGADRRTGGPADRAPETVAAPSSGATVRRSVGPPVRRSALILVLGILIGLGVLFAWRRGSHAAAATGVRLAVLPFENLGDTADAYFAAGVSDAVRGKLTELAELRVIARGSSVQYAGSSKAPREIAAELGVQYLLTGTVRWAKQPDGTSRVQVSPELIQVSDDDAASTWQQSFEAPLTDVFKLQADIAGQVTRAMRVALPGAAQARLAEAPTQNPEAYDALLRARAATNYNASSAPADLRRAIAHFEDAIRLDSTFAEAWSELSTSLSVLYANGTPSPELGRRALAAAERAAALDPTGVQGHQALATYYRAVVTDHERAWAEFEAAREKAPGDASILSGLGLVARSLGRYEDGLRYLQAAYALDPRSPNRAGLVASTLLWLRRPAEARAPAERALALAPGSLSLVQRLAMIYLSEGDLPGARRALAQAGEVDRTELAAYMAVYWDLGWTLPDSMQQVVLGLGADAFDGDPGSTAIVRAQLYHWRGDSAASRAWGDSAQRHFADQLRSNPEDPTRHAVRGLALAYAGRFAEAVSEGERGVALRPIAQDAEFGPYYLHQLARIYLLVGQPAKAMDLLERLLAIPYYLSPAWMRIDPDFKALHGDPRFERLAGGAA